ncbi:MAG: adenylosuccinate lyase [Saprospiraceae bacterium]|nr:adenylosuccinate lyase [Saprospiraceae bacterium]
MLKAISPIDGRYAGKTADLTAFYSEYALIRYRVFIEIQYFTALCKLPLPQLKEVPEEKLRQLERVINQFSEADAQEIKDIEKTTNHDVKAVEYFLKKHFDLLGLDAFKEFVHFGLTSQDINNTATPLMLKQGLEMVLIPELKKLLSDLSSLVESWKDQPMLARTHGQPASPTLLGKELQVFVVRIQEQLRQLSQIPYQAKFGGATGNMNAHYAAYPQEDWHGFANNFVEDYLGMKRSYPTTQIEHYDNLAAAFHALARINTILLDLSRDIWTYISMDYFKQRTVQGEIGSSAMPHKVNPIDFENAEGNLGIANALYEHLAAKLPISRLQRDLTDSTVLRNIGVPVGHSLIAFQAIRKGLSKLLLNKAKLDADLDDNWAVVAEAIQNVLRREGYPNPYEALLNLTRGKSGIDKQAIYAFIEGLDISETLKAELHQFSPANYVGRFL